jgi:hypothetical protein
MNASSNPHAPVAPIAPFAPQIRLYQDWLKARLGLSFETYNELWQWSITDLDAFWQSIWDYFDMRSPTPHSQVLAQNLMPGGQWFPGAQFNYAQQVLRHVQPADQAGFMALICRNEKGQHSEMSKMQCPLCDRHQNGAASPADHRVKSRPYRSGQFFPLLVPIQYYGLHS